MADFFNNKARAAAAAANASSSKAAPSADNTRLQPWVEKYRPKTLSDVAAQDHTTTVLERTLQASNLPHMLFYGPPGTGKTSTVLALSHSLFGPQLFPSRVLELNASDERGISIVRSKIKDFARQTISHVPNSKEYREKYPCPPFKIIILDEADSMTQDAQAALRRTMETYSKITRFCLICNYVTRIIDPLASRCSKFRFKSLDGGNAAKRLSAIAEAENVKLEDGVIPVLIKSSDGDLRKAITFLQSATRLVSSTTPNPAPAPPQNSSKKSRKEKKRAIVDDEDDEDAETNGADTMDIDPTNTNTTPTITPQIISEIAGVVPPSTIAALITSLQPSNPPSPGRTYTSVSKTVSEMIADGWSAMQIVSQLYEALIFGEEGETMVGKQKVGILPLFSEADKRLVDGADEELVVLDLGLRIAGVLARK
ncbi:MAG: hypothetical protein M1834_007187 [Cirrosporium novae-zelandiae]|nr:MAG: hypothetical protein M1834_007187 [Cirrosporium novae-zelandiae]